MKCFEKKSNSADIHPKVKNIFKRYLLLIGAGTPIFIFLHLTLGIFSVGHFSSCFRNSDLCVNSIDLESWFPESDAYREM